ncbi:MAG: DUF1028 domain-containing protein [Elainellaceae cyanobacterium]
MTFSIVARDPHTGMMGVAVSTKNLAVGALVPFAKSNIGAIATQATTNPMLGINGLDLLRQHDAETTLQQLLRQDVGRDHRQIHLVDRDGKTAAWTGPDCVEWGGHLTFANVSIAGNMLVSSDTIQAMADAYHTHTDIVFSERLLLALTAGQSAGGDKRGRQSAALYIVDDQIYPFLDLRVDDHSHPINELKRLLVESQQDYYQDFRRSLPTRTSAWGQVDSLSTSSSIAVQP